MEKIFTAFINGNVFTCDDRNPHADTIVCSGNRIIFAGSRNESSPLLGYCKNIIDLENKLLLPGFTDSHIHLGSGGKTLSETDLSSATSREEFTNTVARSINKGQKFLIGNGWNNNLFPGNILPSKEWIDDVTRDIPVMLYRMDIHTALVNSKLLEIAGINSNTPDPEGGKIDRNDEGNPTGILREAAIEIVKEYLDMDHDIKSDITRAVNELAKYGITSAHDISKPEHAPVFQELEKEGNLTCRVFSRLPLSGYKTLTQAGIKVPFGSDYFHIGSMKDFADGSLGSATALFYEPYNDDPGNKGIPSDSYLRGDLQKFAVEADKAGLQLSMHAIGDKAVSNMLDLNEELNRINGKWDRRFRIEHGQHIIPEDMARIKEENVIISAQPIHLFEDGNWAPEMIGKKRLAEAYPWNSLFDMNIPLIFGSDWPVASFDPLKGIYSAVTRKFRNGKNDSSLYPSEKMSVEKAVKCYTSIPPFAEYREHIKGKLAPGFLADMVLLDKDIFNCEKEEIFNTKVEMTIFDGRIIYRK